MRSLENSMENSEHRGVEKFAQGRTTKYVIESRLSPEAVLETFMLQNSALGRVHRGLRGSGELWPLPALNLASHLPVAPKALCAEV